MSEPSTPHPDNDSRPFKRTLTTVRNVAACYAGTAAEGLVFLLITPFLVRRLGLAAFGLWSLAVALAEWMQLLDLGVRDAVMKYAAAHQARSDVPAVRRVADTALFIYVIVGAVVLALVAVLSRLALPGLLPEGGDLIALRGAFLILGLSAAVSLPAGVTGSLLEGLSRFDLINLFRTGHAALRLVLIVIALQLDLGLVGLALAELTSRLALYAARWTAVHRIDPALVPRPRPRVEEVRRLFGFGLWSAVRQGSETAANRICEPLLAVLTGSASVGAFVVGRRLASISAEFIVPLAVVLFPLSSELDAAGRLGAMRQTLLKTTKFAFFACLPISLVLGLGAGPIQANWLGGRAPEVEPVLMVFSIVFLMIAISLPSEVVLLGLGRVRLLAFSGLGQLAVIAALGAPLTRRYGPSGLAAAALVAILFLQLALLVPIAARLCAVPFSQMLRRALLPPLVAGLPVGLGMFLLRDIVAIGGLASLATWAGGAVLTYAALYYRVGLDQEERSFFRMHLERLLRDPSKIDSWDDSR